MKKTKKAENETKDKQAKTSQTKGQANKIRIWIVLLFLVLTVLIAYVIYRGNYLETLELGEQYLSIFWQNLTNQVVAFLVNFIVLYFIIYLTNRRIRKGLIPFFEDEKKTIPKMLNKSIAFIGAIVISFCMTNVLLGKFLLCINATSFEAGGAVDPVIGLDIGYFVFIQPFIQFILRYALTVIVGITVYGALYYIIAFNYYFDGIDRKTLKQSKLMKQLCTNIIAITILIASTIFVETFNVGLQKFLNLKSPDSGMVYSLWGAGISEVTIKLWGYRILAFLILICVIIAVQYLKKGNTKRVIASLAVVPIYLMLMLVTLAGFELIYANPNELDKQQTYIKANIEATKNAYGINIEEVNLGNNETITKEMLEQNETVTNNIVLASKETVLKNLNTLQTNKGYYTYRTTQMAKYIVNGEPKLVYVSPREITGTVGTYNTKTYEYTHGYGVVITDATTVDENGDLVHLQKEFEQEIAANPIAKIKEPRIYFGLETNSTVVTNSKGKVEFDYPILSSTKAENAENIYEGSAGLRLNFIDRLILAVKEGDFKLAFSGNISSESKILINRNIIGRAKTLMPHILYDENPYLVVTKEGELVWVLDGYTTTDYYPYAQRTTLQKENLLKKKDINYIRNSVKVLINAYDGTMKYYITDRNDPIIMAYQKLYKDLFIEKEETIPEEISSQFVYPELLYQIQAEIMERYHQVQTDVLYRGDDIWEIATHNTTKISTKAGTPIAPYYAMVKTVDSQNATLGLVLPYTPYQKQNITAYLVGSYEKGSPKLTLYKYPSDSNILGPIQIDTQLEQDETIAKEIESLNVTGTRISKNMMVIPMNDSLLYIEPIYQQYINEENSTPVLKKVVVASGNKVAIGNHLQEALDNLVSRYAVDIEIDNTEDIEGLIQAIVRANNNLKQSSQNTNWEMIGKDMARLQELITKLEKLKKEQESQNNNYNITNEINLNNNTIVNTMNQVNNTVTR